MFNDPEPTEIYTYLRTLAHHVALPICHIQGSHSLGAMVVAGPEGFLKNAYRKFNMKNPATSQDDFAMMREMFERRFGRAAREDPDRDSGEWPDLVLIDGGKGQLSAARAILEDMGIEDVCMKIGRAHV